MQNKTDSLNIVVTGATGFVGQHVVGLLRKIPNVVVIPVSRSQLHGVVTVNDYCDTPKGDILIHLAEESDASHAELLGFTYERKSAETVNALLKKGFRQILYASSAMLYGDDNSEMHSTDDPVYPNKNTYLRVKRSAEEAVLSAGGIVARLSNLYGFGMSDKNVFSAILKQVPSDGPVKVMDTSPVRDFLWVDDAAKGLITLAMDTNTRYDRLYNLGTGKGTSIGVLARKILELAGQDDRKVISMCSKGKISVLVLDCDRTLKDYGWQADTTLETGIRKLLAVKVEN